jgi:hypothetical protein
MPVTEVKFNRAAAFIADYNEAMLDVENGTTTITQKKFE